MIAAFLASQEARCNASHERSVSLSWKSLEVFLLYLMRALALNFQQIIAAD
jgi:hypothetical protein